MNLTLILTINPSTVYAWARAQTVQTAFHFHPLKQLYHRFQAAVSSERSRSFSLRAGVVMSHVHVYIRHNTKCLRMDMCSCVVSALQLYECNFFVYLVVVIVYCR